MADNYLEKKMDDYRKGRQSASARLQHGLRCIKIPPLRVLVVNADGHELLLRALCEVGYRVAFTLAAGNGNAMAQSTGAKYIPGSADDALHFLAEGGDQPVGIIAPTSAELPSYAFLPVDAAPISLVIDEASSPNTISISAESPGATALLAIAHLYR